MKFINPIYLLTKVIGVDECGDSVENIVDKRKVFAHIQSVKQSEFYRAQAVGLKPEITFITRGFEYQDENQIEYNNKLYKVLRTYLKEDGTIEIVCTGSDANGNA